MLGDLRDLKDRVIAGDVPKMEHAYYHPNLFLGQKAVRDLSKEESAKLVEKALEPLRRRVVTFNAGPGAGKSTIAAGVYKELWRQGVNCELVTEFAKDMVWEGSTAIFQNQPIVFCNQQHRQFMAAKKHEVVVTDVSLPLNLYYEKQDNQRYEHYANFILENHNKYDNLDYYIDRVKPYNPIGRYQKDINEAKEVDGSILDVFHEYEIELKHFPGIPGTVDLIVDDVLNKLGRERNENAIVLPSVDELLDVDELLKQSMGGFRKCNVINFYGGRDIGKTAMAASVFHELKCRGINCELVLSYAKERFLEDAHGVLNNHPAKIYCEQAHRLERVRDKVDILITDLPLPQILCHGKNMRESLKRDLWECYNEYNNYNFVLNRVKPYNPVEGMETLEDAKMIDGEILGILNDNNIEYKMIL